MKNYVYLNLLENRLIITSVPMSGKQYFYLMDSTGIQSLTICKMFCIGYIQGSESKRKIINDPIEFF